MNKTISEHSLTKKTLFAKLILKAKRLFGLKEKRYYLADPSPPEDCVTMDYILQKEEREN